MAEPEAADTARPARDFSSAAARDSDAAASGTRAVLNPAAAAVLTGGLGARGAEAVHSNGGHRSRDSSAERSHGAGSAPCGIMKVSGALAGFISLCCFSNATRLCQQLLLGLSALRVSGSALNAVHTNN